MSHRISTVFFAENHFRKKTVIENNGFKTFSGKYPFFKPDIFEARGYYTA